MSNPIIPIFDDALRTLFAKPMAWRSYPDAHKTHIQLSAEDKSFSGALMRVNHTGEVCAQALYSAQAFMARDPQLRSKFEAARKEEGDHLAWTKQRLDALDARTSLLNPLWYAASFGLGLLSGAISDKTSLSFVAETERQVKAHLEDHMKRLPTHDYESRAVVSQMKQDEERHGQDAQAAGARELPTVIKMAMQVPSKVMTTVAHFI